MFACESRWHAALDQVTALREGIAAAKAPRRPKTNSNTAAIEEARLVSDELGPAGRAVSSRGPSPPTSGPGPRTPTLVPGPIPEPFSLNEVERLYGLCQSGAISKSDDERKKLELLTW